MRRAHKIRLNPTPEQETYFRKAAGTARFCFNWGLSEIKRALDEGRKPASTLDLKKRSELIHRVDLPELRLPLRTRPEVVDVDETPHAVRQTRHAVATACRSHEVTDRIQLRDHVH